MQRLSMKKTVLVVCGAMVAGLCLLWMVADHRLPATSRVANCVVRLNDEVNSTPSFVMGERFAITGEMQIVRPTDDLEPRYIAYLVVLGSPIKDLVADSGGLQATNRDGHSRFEGSLRAPKRTGDYELRLCLMQSRDGSESFMGLVPKPDAMDPMRVFYRQKVTVK